MEIELPDGTVLEAPDDADIKAVVRGYTRQQGVAKLKAENPAEYDTSSNQYKARYNAQGTMEVDTPDMPAEQQQSMLDMGLSPRQYAQRFGKTKKTEAVSPDQRAAIGSGMVRSVKGVTNLVLPDSLTPDFASDENIKAMDERDEELPLLGKLTGGLAATAPLSGGLGVALSTASRAAPAASVLSRTLASPWTRTALEGAMQGAIYADPDEQGKGALLGVGVGTVLRGAGKGGGRLLRGLVEKSKGAKELEQLAAQHGEDIFLPISQAADEEGIISRLGKVLYKDALPIVPGVKGKLERQGAEAAEKLREIALREASPAGASLPANPGSKVAESVAALQKQFDDAYDQTVKSYAFNVPKDLEKQVSATVKAMTDPKTTINSTTLNQVTSEVKALMTKFSDGKTVIDGQNLLNVKREISDLLKAAKNHEKPVWKAADKWVDDHIVAEMKQGGSPQNLADLARYQDLTPAFRAFAPVKAAAAQASDKEGRFLFKTLARTAKNSPEQRAIGQIGAQTVDQRAAAGGLAGKILAGIGFGGTGFGAFMSPTATATALAGGNLMATKSVQKALLGDTKVQKKIVELLRKHPKATRRVGSAARAAAIQSIEE